MPASPRIERDAGYPGIVSVPVIGHIPDRCRVGVIGGRRWISGAAGLVGLAAILAFCLPTHPPAGAQIIGSGSLDGVSAP